MKTTESGAVRLLRDERGFTLVEVVAAFMIMAVGLLAVEAMGIGAARLVSRAERLSEYNSLAVSELEQRLSDVRLGNAVSAGSPVQLQGATMQTIPTTNGRLVTVRVLVRPAGDRILSVSDSFSVSGYVLN